MSAMSSPAEWTAFLQRYAAAADAKEWPGYPAASEDQLGAAEKRLKVTLPPSYRAFLVASNGWSQASRAVPVLRPAEKIKWFQREHREWVAAYVDSQQGIEPPFISEQDYFNYALGDCANFDVSHLAHTLCLSEVGNSAVLLLNPMVVWPDGEWETWFFANWLPGAIRYRSFADRMRHELAELRNEPFEHTVNPGELPTVFRDGPAKANRRIRRREGLPEVTVILKNLTSAKDRVRVKSAKQLSRLGSQQAVNALLNTLKNDSDQYVRREAAESLGKLGAREAVDALIAAIDDPGVNTTAIHALGHIDDEKGAQCLLKLVEEGGMYDSSAAYVLVQRGDIRPMTHLIRYLASKDPRGSAAANTIALYRNETAYLALEPFVSHADAEIRMRAIHGIVDLASLTKDKTVKEKSCDLLHRCLEVETDAKLREWLGRCVEVVCKSKLK